MPTSSCPYCQYILDGHLSIYPDDRDAIPSPGDVTVCISCASILVFDETLRVRAPRKGEVEVTPDLRRIQAAVREQDRRKW